MSLPPLNAFYIVAALSPLLIVLYLMVFRNWGGSKAGPAGWLVSIIVAVFVFGADLSLLMVAFSRSILLSLYVLYIIWMALLLYHVVNDAGAIDVIGRELPGLATDRPSQALLLGWVFGSFLQGASGFGVPAAVVAPLLVGLGFASNPAVVIALVGHAWAVTFGSLGSSFYSLLAATGEAGDFLSGPSAAFLALGCLACGFGVLWETGKWSAIRRRWGQLLGVGFIMGAVQFGIATAGLWSLAALGAGLVGLVVIFIDLRFSIFDITVWYRRFSRLSVSVESAPSTVVAKDSVSLEDRHHEINRRALFKAIVPYMILTTIIILGQIVFEEELSLIILNPSFREVRTSFGWVTPAGPGRSISVLGHAGALLLYTCIISFIWFKWRGTFRDPGAYRGRTIIRNTLRGSVKSTVGIVTLVAMAVTMQHAAMTQILASALSVGTGPVFPFLSPIIGALGAFMTGSNTNSNVVFGELQQKTALALGISTAVILAAQTAGGAIGSLFAPAKVIVGSSTVEGAQESQVLKKATIYGLSIIFLMGFVALLFAPIR